MRWNRDQPSPKLPQFNGLTFVMISPLHQSSSRSSNFLIMSLWGQGQLLYSLKISNNDFLIKEFVPRCLTIIWIEIWMSFSSGCKVGNASVPNIHITKHLTENSGNICLSELQLTFHIRTPFHYLVLQNKAALPTWHRNHLFSSFPLLSSGAWTFNGWKHKPLGTESQRN